MISNPGDLECPAMNEIPALGRDSLNPFKTSLPPVAKREPRGLASTIIDLVAAAHVKVGRKDKSNRRNGLLCAAMFPVSIGGALIPNKKAAQHWSCAAKVRCV